MTLGAKAFWKETGKQMGILKDSSETDLSFQCRVMLSALSNWMLTTVWGSGHSISIVKIKQVIREKLTGYLKLLSLDSDICLKDIEETIYNVLLENGAFAHLQYNVRPVVHKLIGCGDVSLIRGVMPEERAYFSGLAPFVLKNSNNENLAENFMLWSLNGSETIDLVWRRSTPVDNANLEEYLNIERKNGRYYTGRRNPNWPYTLARSRQSGNFSNYEYYIISKDALRHIPIDYVETSIHEYARLAMMNKVSKQVITASVKEHMVLIECGYLLPAPDLRFMRFVSWPFDITDMKDSFRFILHPAIWPGIKGRLISLGYEVHENHD